jgi:prepilin peptidase CpaA
VIAATLVLLAGASACDVRSRRIPNSLTFPAMAAGLVFQSMQGGWAGLAAAVLGGLAAPATLLAVRAFRRLGMGDLKLAIAVGVLLGPAAGALSMLVSAAAGGLLALGFALRPGSEAARHLGPFLLGVPVLGRLFNPPAPADVAPPTATITLPYGVALAVGTALTLAVIR